MPLSSAATPLRIRRLTTGVVLWLAALTGYVIALLVRHHFGGSLSCDLLASTSNYGEPGWSWLPPGTTCTYSVGAAEEFTTFTTGPGPWTYVVPTLLICWAVSLLRRGPLWHIEVIEDDRPSDDTREN